MTTINELLDRYIPNELPKLARRTQIDTLRHCAAAAMNTNDVTGSLSK